MAGAAAANLTVVIPTFRRPAMLRRALASVARQQQPVLIRVYDNGADPATKAVVDDFAMQGHQIRYHAHQQNLGGNANFAYALSRIQTEFFVILSDDDFLLPGLVDRAMTAFATHPDALFVASPVLLVDPMGQVLRLVGVWPPGHYEQPRGLLEMARREHFTWTGTVFRRSALERAGGLDQDIGLLSDLDLLLRMASRGPFAVVAEPGAIFAWHADSNSSLPTLDQFWPAWRRIAAKVRSDKELPQAVAAVAAHRLERRLVGKLLLVGLFASSRGRIGEARATAGVLARNYHHYAGAALVMTVAWLAARSRRIQLALHWLAWMVRWPPRRSMARIQAQFDREQRDAFRLRDMAA